MEQLDSVMTRLAVASKDGFLFSWCSVPSSRRGGGGCSPSICPCDVLKRASGIPSCRSDQPTQQDMLVDNDAFVKLGGLQTECPDHTSTPKLWASVYCLRVTLSSFWCTSPPSLLSVSDTPVCRRSGEVHHTRAAWTTLIMR